MVKQPLLVYLGKEASYDYRSVYPLRAITAHHFQEVHLGQRNFRCINSEAEQQT